MEKNMFVCGCATWKLVKACGGMILGAAKQIATNYFFGSGEYFKSPTSAGLNNHRQHIYLRIRSQFRFCITMNEGQSQTKTD